MNNKKKIPVNQREEKPSSRSSSKEEKVVKMHESIVNENNHGSKNGKVVKIAESPHNYQLKQENSFPESEPRSQNGNSEIRYEMRNEENPVIENRIIRNDTNDESRDEKLTPTESNFVGGKMSSSDLYENRSSPFTRNSENHEYSKLNRWSPKEREIVLYVRDESRLNKQLNRTPWVNYFNETIAPGATALRKVYRSSRYQVFSIENTRKHVF